MRIPKFWRLRVSVTASFPLGVKRDIDPEYFPFYLATCGAVMSYVNELSSLRGPNRHTGPLAIRHGSAVDIYADMPVGKVAVEGISPDRSIIDQIYESIECPGDRCEKHSNSCFECKLRWWGEQELIRSRKRD